MEEVTKVIERASKDSFYLAKFRSLLEPVGATAVELTYEDNDGYHPHWVLHWSYEDEPYCFMNDSLSFLLESTMEWCGRRPRQNMIDVVVQPDVVETEWDVL